MEQGARFKTLARSVLDVFFPPRCRLCEQSGLAGSALFCMDCAALLEAERAEPSCPRCGCTVAPFEVSGGRCAECRDRNSHVLAVARVGEYFGQLAAMIRAYKYGRHEEFEPILSAFLTEVVARSPWFERVETIVPVPSYWTRRLRRPIHPAEVLAARVASVAGLPIARLLRRTRGGPHQVGLNYTARIANAQGAFAVRSGVELRNTRLLLIDDVRTSGATLEECARVLRRKGAAEVYAGVLVTVSGASAGAAVLTKI